MKAPYRIADPAPYVINDRPDDNALPLRRILKDGADSLSVSELVGVALGRNASLEAGLEDYGSGVLKTLHSVQDICDRLKVDQVQAVRLLAILGLGKRLYEPSQGGQPVLRDSQDVYVHCRSMANSPREQLKVLLLNSRYQLVHEELLAIGSTEYASVQPRDVFQSAVERRVPAVILVHNHPSDNSRPSPSDKAFTSAMQEAGRLLGIELLDHLVVTRETYASCLPV